MATLSDIRPTSDVTTDAAIDNSIGGQTPLWSYCDDDADGLSSDYISNDVTETSGTVELGITDMPADFGAMLTLDVDVDVQASSFSDDTCSLKARILSTGGTPYTDQVTVGSEADSTRTQRQVNFTVTAAGLAAADTDWDAAKLELVWTYAQSGGPDNGQLLLYAVVVSGTYTAVITDAEYTAWLKNPQANRVVLVEATAYDPSTAAETTKYLASEGYYTGSSDTPASTYYIGRLTGDPYISERMTTPFGGRTIAAVGSVEIDNTDDYFTDSTRDWLALSWDGRDIVIRYGDPTWSISDFRTLFTGVIDDLAIVSETRLELIVKDRSVLLDVQIGGRDIITGSTVNRRAPITYGYCYNVEAVQIDADGKDFVVNDGLCNNTVVGSAVYEDGDVTAKSITEDTPHPGAFRLSAATTARVTADVQGMKVAGSYLYQAHTIVRDLITRYGGLTDPDDLDTAAFTQLGTDNASDIGLNIREERNLLEVLDEVMGEEGVLGYYGFDRDGKFTLGQYKDVTGAATVSLTDYDVIGPIDVENIGIPHRSVRLGWRKNWTQQTVSSSADVDQKAFAEWGRAAVRPSKWASERVEKWISGTRGRSLFTRWVQESEHRYIATARNAAIELLHKTAKEGPVIPTLFTNEADASTEAVRRLPLYGSIRKSYTVNTSAIMFDASLHDVITLTDSRLNLASGLDCRLIGLTKHLFTGSCEAVLIGPAETFPTTDVQIEVDQGLTPTTTGTFDLTTTDLGSTTPVAAFFVTGGADAWDDTADANARISFGACDGTNEWTMGTFSEDAVATTDCYKRGMTDQCYHLHNSTGGTLEEGAFDSFITNGVRLNSGTASGTQRTILSTFFAGADVQAKAGTCSSPTADATVNVTGVGFEPDLIILARNGFDASYDDVNKTDEYAPGLYWAVRQDGGRCRTLAYLTSLADGQATSQVKGHFDIDVIMKHVQVTYGAWAIVATHSDGFKIQNYDTVQDQSGEYGYLALKLPGRSIHAAIVDVPTATGNWDIRDFGFAPQFLAVMGGYTAVPFVELITGETEPIFCGVATPDSEGCITNYVKDNVGTSECKSYGATGVIYSNSPSYSDQYAAAYSAALNNGVRLNVTNAQSGTINVKVMALGIA